MRTLKAKLFFSVGAILLFVGVFNIIFAEIWIKRGLSRTGDTIVTYVKKSEDKVQRFSAFLLTLRMVEEAANLERVVYKGPSLTQQATPSLWQKAQDLVSYDPQIAFAVVEKEGMPSVCIAPEDASLLPFSYAPLKEGLLRVRFAGKPGDFIAVPVKESRSGDYLVFNSDVSLQEKVPEVFTQVKMQDDAFGIQDSVPQLFEALMSYENEWLYKIDLIGALLTVSEDANPRPCGALKIAGQSGGYLEASKVLSTGPSVGTQISFSDRQDLFLWLRQRGEAPDLDVVREFSLAEGVKARIGFSVSRVLREIALLSGKTILVKAQGVDLGFRPDGTFFDPKTDTALQADNQYAASTVDFSLFSVIALTPQSEASAISTFLTRLGHEMVTGVSLSLFGASFISFIIALILLRNISGKITEPIAVLSKAAEHLGSGSYEGVVLPKIGHRQDEVAKLTASFAGMVSALQDRDKIRGVLHKVVSKEISDAILQKNLDFTGEERTVTLLFSDIRSFTKMAEGMSAKTLIPMLNSYMTRMCKIIDATHGVVDKFVGDEIMTLYGAPLDLFSHASLAVEAAVLMMEDLASWNRERKKENLPTFEIGIGIHTGVVHTGNMGAENRLNYTAIGANVNLASRVCSAAAPRQILITKETLASCGVQDKFRFRALDPVMLKGIEKPVAVYEVIGRV